MITLAISCLLAVLVVARSLAHAKRDGARALCSPRIFPLAYVTISCTAPMLWLSYRGPLLGVTASELHAETAALMGLSVVAFMFGTSMPFKTQTTHPGPLNRSLLTLTGRLLFVFPVLVAFRGMLDNSVLTRGVDQATRDLQDSVQVASMLAAPVAVLMITAGRRDATRSFGATDFVLLGCYVALQGVNGDRAGAISVLLVAIFAILWRQKSSPKMRTLVGGVLAVLGFAYITVVSRISKQTGVVGSDISFIETVFGDLVSVPFTTGVVARAVESQEPLGGTTIGAAMIRLLPGPVAASLIGPVDDTGSFKFREIIAINSSQGWGFSLPAEGVLNFGPWGVVVAPFCYGAVLSWTYSHASLFGDRARNFAYFIAASSLPIAWRSDILGATKGVLYPLLLTGALLLLARARPTIQKRELARDGK